jgi:hypothetical protein
MRFSNTSIVLDSKLPPSTKSWLYRLGGFVVLTICSLTFPVMSCAQDFMTDVGVFGGKLLKAPAHSTTGLEFGFGRGKNFVTVKVAGDSFESYAVGVGTSLFSGQAAQCVASVNCRNSNPYYYLYDEPVSASKAADFSGMFSRDLYSIPGRRVTLYGSAGGGFIHNTFQVTVPCGLGGPGAFCQYGSCCTPPGVQGVSIKSWGTLFGTGIRTRVWNDVNIRADIELWRTFGGQTPQLGYYYGTSSATIPRLTIGLYFRTSTGWLSR